ncbi:MAG: UPF0175 family protein [Anaerolineae bacterium]|nr:UPF0175 family protein [Anaerolineae bacterium]
MSEVTVILELPRAFVPLVGKSEKDLPLELKKLLALELVRRGTLTYSRAAELIGISQAEFVQYLGEHGVSIFQYTEDN